MKTITKSISFLVCILSVYAATAQTPPVREPDLNKPLLFQQLPAQLTCRIPDLVSLFRFETGELVSFNVADNFAINGVVSSTATRENGKIVSVVVRSMNFSGAVLSFSKITPEDGEPYYTGRIISLQHGDGFEIVNQNGTYVLYKKGFYDMINE